MRFKKPEIDLFVQERRQLALDYRAMLIAQLDSYNRLQRARQERWSKCFNDLSVKQLENKNDDVG
jgi:hypothetical protein